MSKAVLTRSALGAALLATIPTTVTAQDATTTPEGIRWHLAGYAVAAEIGAVP